MTRAVEAMKSCELGINRSALEYGVPKTTLKDRIAGRVKHGTKPGPVAYLDPSEEEELVNFLFECSRVGYGKTERSTTDGRGFSKKEGYSDQRSHKRWLVVSFLSKMAQSIS